MKRIGLDVLLAPHDPRTKEVIVPGEKGEASGPRQRRERRTQDDSPLLSALEALGVLDGLSKPRQRRLAELVQRRLVSHELWRLDAPVRRDLLNAARKAKPKAKILRGKLRQTVEALNDLADYVEGFEATKAGQLWLRVAESADFEPQGFDVEGQWHEGTYRLRTPVAPSASIREDARRYATYELGDPKLVVAEVEAVIGSLKTPTARKKAHPRKKKDVDTETSVLLAVFFEEQCRLNRTESRTRAGHIVNRFFGQTLAIQPKATLETARGSETMRSRMRRAEKRMR